jgi:hypothetical protein
MSVAHPAFEAVGELVKPHKMTIEINPLGDPVIRYRVLAPCLLRQLADCALGGMRVGVAGGFGSRAPINVDVLDLWSTIASSAYAWAEVANVARVDPLAGRHAIPWVGRLLRTTVASVAGRGDFVEMLDRIDHNAHRWATEIRTMVTGQPVERGVRGAECPECRAKWVTEYRPGEGRVRAPVIVLTVREVAAGPATSIVLRWLTCLACGWSMSLGVADVAAATVSVA